MTIYQARKRSMTAYLAAFFLLVLYLVLRPGGLWRVILIICAMGFAAAGYWVAAKYSRCPKCAHVLQVGLRKITRCSYCGNAINARTTRRF